MPAGGVEVGGEGSVPTGGHGGHGSGIGAGILPPRPVSTLGREAGSWLRTMRSLQIAELAWIEQEGAGPGSWVYRGGESD